jgi:membrane protease subunit HflK
MKSPPPDQDLTPVERAARRTLGLLALLFLGVLSAYVASGCHFVAPGESALVLRFGRVLPSTHGPGLLLAFPPPVDRVLRFPTGGPRELALDAWRARDLARTTPEDSNYGPLRHELHPARDGYTLTADANILQGAFTLRYQITDPARLHRAGAEGAPPLLEKLFQHAATRVLARSPVDTIIPAGLDLFRDQVLTELSANLAALDLGVLVVGLEIRELLPPRPVLPAFNDVNSAKVEGRTFVEEARAHRARIDQAARGEAATLRARAGAEAEAAIIRARGEAEAFLAQLGAAAVSPLDFRSRLLAETREQVLPKLRHGTVFPEGGAPLLLLRPDGPEGR